MLTCTSCCVLQAVQQDEAWSEAEAASRALPVRNVVPDDVAALSFFNDFFNFPSCFYKIRPFVPQTAFLISRLFGASSYFPSFFGITRHYWGALFSTFHSFGFPSAGGFQFVETLPCCCRPLRFWNTVETLFLWLYRRSGRPHRKQWRLSRFSPGETHSRSASFLVFRPR